MSDHITINRASSVSLGTVVILLYTFFVLAVFSGFATYIYRAEWHTALALDPEGPQDLDNLIFAIKREDALRTEIAVLEGQLSAALQIGSASLASETETQIGPQPLKNYSRIQQEHSSKNMEVDALPFTPDERSTGRARLSALSTNIWVIGDTFRRLVSFPTIFLTLIVTIAAGGLGTMVAFSRRYYEGGDAVSMARLFVNVGEGIAAAVAIFLFSGAGMLALTNGAGPANAVELSPYSVAFMAFLSGFMAEDAFASIQAAGKRIFQRDGPKEDAEQDVTDKPSDAETVLSPVQDEAPAETSPNAQTR
ncbi:MAG: hypothetical protein ABJQ34_17020 [Paracoccaceae bacterium]